jgi:hypothetical protein
MPWNTLTNNQAISRNNLQNAVNTGLFTLKSTIPATNECVTKTEANSYVYIDPSYPPFASKTDNQLVVKQDLKAYKATLYITNNFFTGTITNVTVNGFSVTEGSFPLNVGDSTTAYSDQVGTYDILVYYADATNPSNYMRITDSEYSNTCVDGFSSLGPGPYYVTFSNQVIVTTIPVNIESGDGTCTAPPPTLISTLPFSTVAVSRGTGQYMLAGNANIGNPFTEGTLFRSTNYGANWTLVGQLGYWNKVAISDNGQYMLAVEYYGRAYKSSDYGSTWTAINNFPFPTNNPCGLPILQTLSFRGAALSADGQYQVICTASTTYGTCGSGPSAFTYRYSTIFVSNDYGATWSSRQFDSSEIYNAVAISANGQTILAAQGNQFIGRGLIRRSTNYGVNWSDGANSINVGNLVDVAITADGGHAIAARFSNDIIEVSPIPYLLSSYDGGATWYDATFGDAQNYWMRVAINNNGTPSAWALPNTTFPSLATKNLYEVQVFLNYVVPWTQIGPKFYKSVANSNNAQYILLGANNGLFVSNNYGYNWTAIQSVG